MAFDQGSPIQLIAASAAPPTTGVGVLKAYKLPTSLKTETRHGIVKKIMVTNLTGADAVVWFDDGNTDATAITASPAFPPLNIGTKQTVIMGENDEINWRVTSGLIAGSPGAAASPTGIYIHVMEVDVRS